MQKTIIDQFIKKDKPWENSYKERVSFLLESRLKILSYLSMVIAPIYLLIVYLYLKLPFDFSLFGLFFIGFLPIIFNVIKFKPVSQRPFFSIFWIIFFINLYLDNILKAPESFDVLYRAIIFCPYLLVAGFLPFKINQLTSLTILQIGLYVVLNQDIAPHVFYQELFIFFLLISIFILNHYHGHKTLKTWTYLQFEKKQTYKKLIRMEHQYREVYDYGGVARALISEEGEIIDINPEWKKIFKDFLSLGKDCKALAPYLLENKEEFRQLKEKTNYFLIKNAVKVPHYFLRENKNSIFQIHIWYSPALSKYFLNLLDTTESILKEKEVSQKEKLVHLGLSAAGCAHDIFNPLSSIILNLDLIGENNEHLKQKYGADHTFLENDELTSKSLEASDAIKTLVERLKSFTKNLQSKKVRSNLVETIQFANEIFHLPLKDKVSLEIKGDIDSSYFISDPANNFFQVFLNLFNNSYNSFQKEDYIERKIVIKIREKKYSRVELKVLDYGSGIPKNKIKNIFDNPFQSNNKNSSGIGLFITKKMVEKIGGSIELQSEEGKYTEVTLNLPFHKNEKTPKENLRIT